MKKITLLVIMFVMLGSIGVKAQQGFHAGIKLIPQTVWMFNKDLQDSPTFRYRNHFRFAFGATLDYHFNDQAGVGVDLIYSPQGQAFVVFEGGPESLIKVNYFKLPVLFHFNGDPENVAMFMGEFGPQFAFLTSAEDPDGNDVSEAYKSVNIGLVLGLGVGFNITDYLVASIKIRLDAGLTNAGNEDPMYWGSENRVWMVTGGMPEIGFKYVLRTD